MTNQLPDKLENNPTDNSSTGIMYNGIMEVFKKALEYREYTVIILALFVWLMIILATAARFPDQDLFSTIIGSGVIVMGISLIGLLYRPKLLVDSKDNKTLTVSVEDAESEERLDNADILVDLNYGQTTEMGPVAFDGVSGENFTVYVKKEGYHPHNKEYSMAKLDDPPKITVKLKQVGGQNLVRVHIEVYQSDQPNNFIKKAQIRLNIPYPILYTDNTGRLQFEVRRDQLQMPIEITVIKPCYEQQQPLQISKEDVENEVIIPVSVDRIPACVESEMTSISSQVQVESETHLEKSGVSLRPVIALVLVGIILVPSIGYALGQSIRNENSFPNVDTIQAFGTQDDVYLLGTSGTQYSIQVGAAGPNPSATLYCRSLGEGDIAENVETATEIGRYTAFTTEDGNRFILHHDTAERQSLIITSVICE